MLLGIITSNDTCMLNLQQAGVKDLELFLVVDKEQPLPPWLMKPKGGTTTITTTINWETEQQQLQQQQQWHKQQ